METPADIHFSTLMSVEVSVSACFDIMRAVIQRVLSASVQVGDDVVSLINRGLCVLIGIGLDDTEQDIEYISRKILNIRLWSNADEASDQRWSKSVQDLNLSILCISQFTLHATLKGNKPDFHYSMPAEKSRLFYNQLLEKLKHDYAQDKIFDGIFGAKMLVNIANDGPVTIVIDSKIKKHNATSSEDVTE
ncbi:unnamed protein product [Didymodactylos carnosus]|uniref:D-aminoacyl-tRNA deacylase n=1 Tax=Didymodactylos carnosus TaxID=1234261 RepID=A0A813WIC0_9BILA|nr:unnamed protein product [Didymodactylos carnosus]CAF1001964.1 unnamed protein product [Didymodactylos carnosus]CAF3645533.1 unnamed protein product [Didymodactylos carnosus]CAF3771370.1 unnamed protein product [Didymodactylos carnosus]